MVEYVLEHPYGGEYGKFKSIKDARATALKLIKKHYPTDGKHFAEMDIMKNGVNIGRIYYGDKYRGRDSLYTHLSKVEKIGMSAYYENHYVDMVSKHEDVYHLNADGSLGQKYVHISGLLGAFPVGFATTKAEAVAKAKSYPEYLIADSCRTPAQIKAKKSSNSIDEHIAVYNVGKDGVMKKVSRTPAKKTSKKKSDSVTLDFEQIKI